RLGAGDALDPMDFQLFTDNLPAAGGSATVRSCVSPPVVIDPVAEDGPVGMVMDVQRGPWCLERLDQHGNAITMAIPTSQLSKVSGIRQRVGMRCQRCSSVCSQMSSLPRCLVIRAFCLELARVFMAPPLETEP